MSNSRYNFKTESEFKASMIHKEDSTLSYTFHPEGNHDNQAIHVTLLYVAISKFGNDWVSLPHYHNFTELFYITNGTGKFSAESNILEVKTNDLIVLNPTIVHTEISNPSKPMEYIVMGVEGIQFQSENRGCILLNSSVHKSDLHHYFNTLAHEMKQDQPYRDFVCQNLLNIIFSIILRNEAFKISITNGPGLTRECSIAKKYIEDHYSENITIETLSSLVHLNKYYFAHNFAKQFGTSPINYLIMRRVAESKHLLTNTNYSLSTISHIVGFSSPSYFTQTFKRITNVSPQTYRKMYQNSIPV